MTELLAYTRDVAQTAGGLSSVRMSTLDWPLLFLIPFLPLLGSAMAYFFTRGERVLHGLSGWIASVAAASSFAVVLMAYSTLTGAGVDSLSFTVWRWISVGSLDIDLSFRFDRLAAVMCLVVTGIGSLIHIYAIGYMRDDESRPRFFAYLNLFLFAMLLLVLGENLVVMFVGWEGVGLCSYLLIGFWSKEMGNAIAGQKAFVVNRIGDAGFLLGMFLILGQTGTLSVLGIQAGVGEFPPQLLDAAALLLFVGAIGKSAQIPLFVWLPDAMAGPTPVSALIHAATMVTAGVYMIARLGFLFAGAPVALMVIGIIGTLTAFLAATIAIVQNDIKKVLAYSTVSQLGYMFMAMGAGAFSNGIYHVVTHAFFKACLFMAAGSVIIGCHHEQDMREYGGLWKKMPITFATYLCAVLAIAGIPPFSGFYSKDAILWAVYSRGTLFGSVGGLAVSQLLWGVGLVTAFLTAFYMTRSLVMTFFGEYRGHAHPHESPPVVWIPLLLLAIPSLFFGMVLGSEFLLFLSDWGREDILKLLAHDPEHAHALELEHLLARISIGVAVAGMALALFIYGLKPMFADRLARALPRLYLFLLEKWRIDELYNMLIVRPLGAFAMLLFRAVDRSLIDGMVNGMAVLVEAHGDAARRLHTGRISEYALWMFLGNVVIVLFWLLIR